MPMDVIDVYKRQAAGSKLTKAQSLGVMTMSEEEFVQEVENAKE